MFACVRSLCSIGGTHARACHCELCRRSPRKAYSLGEQKSEHTHTHTHKNTTQHNGKRNATPTPKNQLINTQHHNTSAQSETLRSVPPGQTARDCCTALCCQPGPLGGHVALCGAWGVPKGPTFGPYVPCSARPPQMLKQQPLDANFGKEPEGSPAMPGGWGAHGVQRGAPASAVCFPQTYDSVAKSTWSFGCSGFVHF